MAEKQTFQLLHIVLLESHFRRDVILDESYARAETKFEVNSQDSALVGDIFSVYLNVSLRQELESKVMLDMYISMNGSFKANGAVEPHILKSFCKVNAPAIIFPFVREAIASITTRAGIFPILVQPINFVELAKAEQTQQSQVAEKVTEYKGVAKDKGK